MANILIAATNEHTLDQLTAKRVEQGYKVVGAPYYDTLYDGEESPAREVWYQEMEKPND